MTIVFSVIFPNNLIFFPDFLKSLENQEDKNFKLILINDGVSNIESYFKSFSMNIEVHNVKNMSPTEIRLFGFEKIINSCSDYVIFADTDDLLCSKRVLKSVEKLQNHSFVCNDISLISDKGELLNDLYWSNRISNNYEFGIQFIKNKNFFGLGNSAMKSDKLHLLFPIFSTIPKVNDWLLFSSLGNEFKAIFTTECRTFYRQHNLNIIGKKKINKKNLLEILNTKIEHYFALKKNNFDAYNLDEQIKHNQEILQLFSIEPNFLEEQLIKINALEINFFWWEETNYINLIK
jgi:glycosyltransferase involved in cell wall biosynthesis